MSANVYHPSRGGVRGGKDQFNWDDVKSDKDRECYLGHSVKAPVGRWQKGKDLVWYTRGKDGEMSEAERRKQELRSVKEMEAHAMAAALGYKVPQNPMSKDDAPKTTESEQAEHTIEGSEKKKNKRKKEKHAKKKKKHKRKYSSSGDEENENDRKRRKEKTRKRDRSSSDSCEDDGKIRHRDTRSDVITDRQSQNERPKKRRSIDERDIERNDRHSKKEKYRDRCIDSNGEEMYSSRTQKQDGNDPRRRKGDRSEGRHSEERDAEDRNSRRRNDDERDFNNRKRENRQRDNYREEDGDRKRRRADRRDGD